MVALSSLIAGHLLYMTEERLPRERGLIHPTESSKAFRNQLTPYLPEIVPVNTQQNINKLIPEVTGNQIFRKTTG